MDNLTSPSPACKIPGQTGPHAPIATGVFPHARWRRMGAFETEAPATPYESARYTLSRLPTSAVLERHRAISQHTHRRWSPTDRATHDEMVARCWGVGELSSLKMVGLPRWMEPVLYRTSPTGRNMSRPGWRPFLAFVIGAFRGGAGGVRLTNDEWVSEAGVSIATVKRYVPELVELGLITKIKVGREVVGGGNLHRANDSNVYQPGPVLLAQWHALLEGCSSRVPYGGPNAKRAKFAAHELREDAKEFRRARELAARASHPSPGLPGKLRRPDVEGHEADAEGHNADAFEPRRGRERNSARAPRGQSDSLPPKAKAADDLVVPPRGITDAELDELDAELAELSAQRSSVGAASNSEPAASAEGPGPAGDAPKTVSRPKYQGGLTTRSRSKNRDSGGPKGPGPSADAAGSELEAAPTLERCALCRGSSADGQGRGSRCSHSLDADPGDPRPLRGGKSQASVGPVRSPSLTAKITDSEPEAPQPAPRGDKDRPTTPADEGPGPSTGANYDWRGPIREHIRRGGSLRFLDPRLRAELGFNDDDDDDDGG